MTTATDVCPAVSCLEAGGRESASAVPDIASADIALTYEPPWTPDLMSLQAREGLGNA